MMHIIPATGSSPADMSHQPASLSNTYINVTKGLPVGKQLLSECDGAAAVLFALMRRQQERRLAASLASFVPSRML